MFIQEGVNEMENLTNILYAVILLAAYFLMKSDAN